MLPQMRQRLIAKRTFEQAVSVIMDDVVALHGAEFGTFQLLVGDELIIVAQRGFRAPFLRALARLNKDHGTACARALKHAYTVVIQDVEQDADYAPFRQIARDAGYRAVQSTPLICRGTAIGVVSTHFANVHEPTGIEIQTLAEYVGFAGDRLRQLAPGDSLATKAEDMCRNVTA